MAPLRGFGSFSCATGGCAALHPRLFELRRSAAGGRTIRVTLLRGDLPDDSRRPVRPSMRTNRNAPRRTGASPLLSRAPSLPGAAERQDVNSRGWSAANPRDQKSCGPRRVAASQPPDWQVRGAATRLFLVSARDRGFRCDPPPAIRVRPLRGRYNGPSPGCWKGKSPSRPCGQAGRFPSWHRAPALLVPRSGKM